ncbi:MAG: imidazole glycerol phosphate synthase subunit HisH [Thermoguttaceae bacterium]|nr:imidazole glycerol phosphate synthase subunit HisH [Thermoguttaceae bacterium]
MIAIVDYGVGNLFSLHSSFAYLGAESKVTGNVDEIRKADRIVLPGVGAFDDAAARLRNSGLADVLIQETSAGKLLLGICLGMQLLLDRSFEYGEHRGLGLIHGDIVPIRPVVSPEYKVPQIGWNTLHFPKHRKVSPLFKNIREGEHVYFVHSYHATHCDESIIATTEYDAELTAAVARDNVFGVQFHPEKSGQTGLNILRAFCEL